MDDRLDDLGRLDADVQRDADVVLELRLGSAERGQRRDRGELPCAVVEPRPAVDVAVSELDDVASQVGGDVADALDRPLALLSGQLTQALPTRFVAIVRQCANEGTPPSDPGPTIAAVDDHDDALARSIKEAEELLEIEEADAWFEYLESTRNQSVTRYREVEPWAWARLNQRLRALGARRAKLKPATAA